MLAESRTKHDFFNEYKYTGADKEYRFREWFSMKWGSQIRFYEANKWYLIPLGIRSKSPFQGYRWKKRTLDYDKALQYAQKDVNLGVVLEYSGLVLVDWDSRVLPDPLERFKHLTRTAITPRGWHFYLKGNAKENVCERIRQKLQGKGDMFRYAMHYSVVPLSCVKRDDDDPAKVYEWVNDLPVMDFDRFVGEMI